MTEKISLCKTFKNKYILEYSQEGFSGKPLILKFNEQITPKNFYKTLKKNYEKLNIVLTNNKNINSPQKLTIEISPKWLRIYIFKNRNNNINLQLIKNFINEIHHKYPLKNSTKGIKFN